VERSTCLLSDDRLWLPTKNLTLKNHRRIFLICRPRKHDLSKLKNSPLNLPPLESDNKPTSMRWKRFPSSHGFINRSMKSDHASSSMPGFCTPSTMDSRQILMRKVSMEYPTKFNKKAASKFRREFAKIMRK
jgi:hypothetical protein